ncbi:MAG: Stk1 family PASTA domain-containing Ser/Thr kinase [Yaniella sp.]|uniref:Stk1 family PASTA domain-containing Ser/Thr kinase n=2 Tax=Yaniella sp. TaxID=2773929 RepID=UPI00264A302B|nr:Stk1 family PASTA domain-containing Ser/Thr kinase [Yaniella sp.]MDN5816012.1 Stk1 family PASTA domain-containing Ser/Thr kinase [Yaniella sp.]MDN5819077.1 Stk1 family PASTA domain-containing Ser/Thr kinase [Yaniella sp.]MDN5913481.1 Stk1 family PASTA domain-containing Ser/Thr kinase [Yaniella sp.]MDN6456400.1 Stk1 family PASTA domain-containing Ser/Thr kinase [Yaniella sp.]
MSQQRIINGRYEVGELIGRGGMADVYLGRDERLGRTVAIKMMRADLARDPQFQTRFRREAHASAALNHPNIVAVFDTGEEELPGTNGQPGVACPYMVMEYVDGDTLRALLRKDEVTIDLAVEWTEGVLAAVAYSHENDIVHRDIKPGNVMVDKSGAIKVMDFGIARALSDSSATMTQTQAVVGTAQYLSPEQARGESVDFRSDLYSVGCVLFELLTGRPPFVGDSPVAVAYQHVREEPPAATTLIPEISPALESVLTKSLAKDREDRFQTGKDFLTALRAAHYDGIAVSEDESTSVIPPAVIPADTEPTQAMGAISASDDSIFEPREELPEHYEMTGEMDAVNDPERSGKKKRRGWLIALLLILLLGGGAFAGWWFWNEAEQQRIEENQVQVPDVSGMPETDAQNALTTAGLRPILEYEHNDDVDRDRAIGTDPASETTMQRYDEVTLNISLGPDQVDIPDSLQGASEATVRDTLEELGLTVSDVSYVNSPTIPRDRLVDTNPALGSTVAYGSTVALKMSSGEVEVPNVVGMTQQEAENTLTADALGLSVDINLVTNDGSMTAGQVVDQDVEPGETASQGQLISLDVAREEEEPSGDPSESESPSESDSPSESESPSEEESSDDPSEDESSDEPSEDES